MSDNQHHHEKTADENDPTTVSSTVSSSTTTATATTAAVTPATTATAPVDAGERIAAAKRHIAALKENEQKQRDEREKATTAVPFLEQPLDELRGMTAKEMKALMDRLVKETTKEQIEAQKNVHSTEIESMQKLMMDAKEKGLLDEEDNQQCAVDADGNEMQTTSDGGIMLKNKAGDHNPILDELRKKQKRGLLSKEEEEMLERAIAYQTRMTGAAGKAVVEEEEEEEAADNAGKESTGKEEREEAEDDEDATMTAEERQEFAAMRKKGDAMMARYQASQGQASHAAAEEQQSTLQNADGTTTMVFHPSCTIVPAMRGMMMPMVAANGSAELPGNSLAVCVRIALLQDVADNLSFVLGTARNVSNPQDADYKPQRWADTKTPITGAELKENGFIQIDCNENDVIFNNCMVGVTLLNGTMPQRSISVAVSFLTLDENEPVGAVGAAASSIAEKTRKDKVAEKAVSAAAAAKEGGGAGNGATSAVVSAMQRQQQKQQQQHQGPKRSAPKATPPPSASSAQKKKATNAATKTATSTKSATNAKSAASATSAATRTANSVSNANGADDSDDEDEPVAGVDETGTLRPQLPPNATLPSAPTRKQVAADPNNPKFDPLPVKERVNRFSVGPDGKPLAPDLPDGVAGQAADGTVIPIVNAGASFNPKIPDVFGNMEYRNTLMTSEYEPEKDRPMFYNHKIQFIVMTVIGPEYCRIKTSRCVMRIFGFAKNKKECGMIHKWARSNVYMGYLWDIGVVPAGGFFPVPPIYAEDATSTYSNPLHKAWMDYYINEQKRAAVELEQRVLDDKVTHEKKANTLTKQVARAQNEIQSSAQQQQQQQQSAQGAPQRATATQQQQLPNHRAPLAQRIARK